MKIALKNRRKLIPVSLVYLSLALFSLLFQNCSGFSAINSQVGDLSSTIAPSSTDLESSFFPNVDTATPADSRVLNVKSTQFGAYGDGVHDDTQAILKAIGYSSISPALAEPFRTNYVFLPEGTYLVSSTLQKLLNTSSMSADAVGSCTGATCYASGLVLVGAGPSKTIVKLMDNAPGFQDATNPKAVVFTASSFFDPSNTKDHANLGEGNDAYSNFIEALTVDVGNGNPGAIGVDYLGNNTGAVRNVLIRASASSGAVGLSLIRKWSGPAIIENVMIKGFNISINAANTTYTTTFLHTALLHPKQIGLQSADHVISMQDLTIIDAPQPIVVEGADALSLIAGATISAPNLKNAPSIEAFTNAGIAHMRDFQVTDYGTLLGTRVSAASVNAVYSGNQISNPNSKASWSAAVLDFPQLSTSDVGSTQSVTNWASVVSYGAKGDGDTDDTAAIQAALNSGSETVVFPTGIYRVNANILVPPTVRVLKGYMAALRPCSYGSLACSAGTVSRGNNFDRSKGVLLLSPTTQPLIVEKISIYNNDLGGQLGMEITGGSYAVLLKDVVAGGSTTARDAPGAPLFIDDYLGSGMSVAGSQPVQAYQLNIEGGGPAVTNSGTPLRILGMKSEGNETLVQTQAGGSTELLGGLTYMVYLAQGASPVPVLINTASNTLATFAEEAFYTSTAFTTYLQSTRNGVTTSIPASSFPARDSGHLAPFILAP